MCREEEMGEEWTGDSSIPEDWGVVSEWTRLSAWLGFGWIDEGERGGAAGGGGGSPLCAAAETSLSRVLDSGIEGKGASCGLFDDSFNDL